MKNLIQMELRRNAYFLLAAAWLFTIAFIINNYWTDFNSIKYLRTSIERYIQRQEKDFNGIIRDTSLLRRLASQQYSEDDLKIITEKQYGVYVYEPHLYGLITLKFWNNQYALPTSEILSGKENSGFAKLPSGQYEFMHRTVHLSDGKNIVVIGLIPIHKEYFIQINSLKTEFVQHRQAEKKIGISPNPTNYPVKSSYGNTLFHLYSKPAYSENNSNWFSLGLGLIAVLFLLIFLNNMAGYIARSVGYLTGIIFLIGTLIFLRALTYLFPRLVGISQYELFHPSIYSSGYILNSLGDLLINSFLFSWVVIFIRNVVGKRTLATFKDSRWRWPLVLSSLILLVILTFSGADIIQSLIADARISFNVTNFFSLNVYSFVGFLVLASISFAFFFLSKITLRLIEPLLIERKYGLFIIIAIAGLSIVTLIGHSPVTELNLYALVWLLVYVWLMQRRVFSGLFHKLNISIVLFWLFIFSISISIIIIYENQKIELDQRKRTAEKLSTQADPTGERLISIALTYFDNDFLFHNFDRFKIAASNTYLKDSLATKNFSPFLNIFDTKIYTFDAGKSPLFNRQPVSFDTLNTIFEIEGKLTSVNDVRYFEKAFDKYSYIFKKVVLDSTDKAIGYFFVLYDPKRYKSDALVPELFRQNKDFLPEYSPIYSYAVYNNLELFDYYNNYPFPTHLRQTDVPKQGFKQYNKNGYDELWYIEGKDKVVIFAKKDNYFIEAITLFAYIFSTFLLLVAIFRIITLLIQSRMRWSVIRQYWQLNIRSQIHGTIIFISLFSFLVIGVATIIFFNNRYDKNNQERLSKAIQIMANDIQKQIQDQEEYIDELMLYETDPKDRLERLLKDVAEIHGAEINLYELDGTLQVASNPFIYGEGILSTKMNPQAYYHMSKEELVQYINQEQMGDVVYQSIYSPVRYPNGEAYAYLNIPSFVSQEELKKEISNFLVTIINLNAFIFLVAGVIALFITNRITSSFLLIGHKMREINLGKLNEEIAWNRDDEIGGLVKEYNKMVVKLGDSALALAKSEREGAWREMARQVAHEIKNPLTPMKLSIQYLQKAIDNDSVNVKELSSNVARTLIEQIDHLSKIAADFSQFANIGNVRNEVFDLHDILYSLSSLYESMDNLQFKWKPLDQRILVRADKTQLNRLFTNLFQNAVEACTSRGKCLVIVTEEVYADKVIITVTDNGDGIPEPMQSKIFTPNFTTKSSGTGLGLAMSKTIVEQAKGNIWFKTIEGKGASFFVELPVIRTAN
ncbi:MAG: HAMP domain-containing sensor histidine kinase [Chitinophagaceae bacterium]